MDLINNAKTWIIVGAVIILVIEVIFNNKYVVFFLSIHLF
jgi:hypothetical protein